MIIIFTLKPNIFLILYYITHKIIIMSCVDKTPPIIAWKGKTFSQITSSIKRNKNTNYSIETFLLPNPVTRQYRREIALVNEEDTQCGSERISVSIDELTRPNGYFVPATTSEVFYGIQGTLDPIIPNDQTVLPTACQTCNGPENCLTSSTDSQNVCFTEESKARRRCRSAGMVQNRFKVANNNDRAYFTDNKQYLTSRNRLFSQNQYNFIRQGLPDVTAGSPLAQNNVYSANGLSHCPLYPISEALSNNRILYSWVDGTTDNTITIPDGSYDIYSFNQAVQQSLIQNTHYFTNINDFTLFSLIRFSFDTNLGLNTLQLLPAPDPVLYNTGGPWSVTTANTPTVTILPNGLDQGLGITSTTYPASTSTAPVTVTAQSKGQLQPNYVVVSYKPSNFKFAKQGGVSSSAYLQRKKYDNVNTVAALSGPPNFGQEVANELAYSVPFVGYTTKDKVGFTNTAAPVITPTGQLRSCSKYIYRY